MSAGSIIRRGKSSWRLKFELPRTANGERRIAYVTVKGKREDAQKELRRRLTMQDKGIAIAPNKITVAEFGRAWLAGAKLAGRTRQRWSELLQQQVIAHLPGSILLQALRPAHVAAWHQTLLERGGKNGRPLSALTVRHAHRLLHLILKNAAALEITDRNVAALISPPKVEEREIQILEPDQVTKLLTGLEGHRLHLLAVLGIGTGMRRSEMLALSWGAIDLDGARISVTRALEETSDGVAFKEPKTKAGRRTIALAASTVDALRAHRKRQLEERMALGLGRPDADTLLLSHIDGSPMRPDSISAEWVLVLKARKLPRVSLHSLRHFHASQLVAAGLDPLAISRRLGHSKPSTTLNLYGHAFKDRDALAAAAIEAALQRK